MKDIIIKPQGIIKYTIGDKTRIVHNTILPATYKSLAYAYAGDPSHIPTHMGFIFDTTWTAGDTLPTGAGTYDLREFTFSTSIDAVQENNAVIGYMATFHSYLERPESDATKKVHGFVLANVLNGTTTILSAYAFSSSTDDITLNNIPSGLDLSVDWSIVFGAGA